jgi:hypothetical protein
MGTDPNPNPEIDYFTGFHPNFQVWVRTENSRTELLACSRITVSKTNEVSTNAKILDATRHFRLLESVKQHCFFCFQVTNTKWSEHSS